MFVRIVINTPSGIILADDLLSPIPDDTPIEIIGDVVYDRAIEYGPPHVVCAQFLCGSNPEDLYAVAIQ